MLGQNSVNVLLGQKISTNDKHYYTVIITNDAMYSFRLWDFVIVSKIIFAPKMAVHDKKHTLKSKKHSQDKQLYKNICAIWTFSSSGSYDDLFKWQKKCTQRCAQNDKIFQISPNFYKAPNKMRGKRAKKLQIKITLIVKESQSVWPPPPPPP